MERVVVPREAAGSAAEMDAPESAWETQRAVSSSRAASKTTWGWRTWPSCTPKLTTSEPRRRAAWAQRSSAPWTRSEEHTSELQSRRDLVCRLLLEKKKTQINVEIEHRQQLSNIEH